MKEQKVCKHITGMFFVFVPKEAALKLGLKQGQRLQPVVKRNGLFYKVKKMLEGENE